MRRHAKQQIPRHAPPLQGGQQITGQFTFRGGTAAAAGGADTELAKRGATPPHLKVNIEKKALVLILLVLVCTHTLKRTKYMFVYIQQSK
jgi:hypothetical protein